MNAYRKKILHWSNSQIYWHCFSRWCFVLFFLLIHQNLAPVFCTQIQLQSQKQAALFPENASLFLYGSQEILLKDKTENNLLVIYERQFS